ncbi:MAG: DUF3175 domain-containing protein [Gammaproteobacteria bacterium]|jgi:hypothetical protein
MPKKTKSRSTKRWSAEVTRDSHALALEDGVFTWKNPVRIARSLKRSADESTDRKAPPLRSAMSMLTFYINRAGTNLDENQKRILEQAKDELRKLYRNT